MTFRAPRGLGYLVAIELVWPFPNHELTYYQGYIVYKVIERFRVSEGYSLNIS
jgi:hypothetical protein